MGCAEQVWGCVKLEEEGSMVVWRALAAQYHQHKATD